MRVFDLIKPWGYVTNNYGSFAVSSVPSFVR
jgi:hypothetical protein